MGSLVSSSWTLFLFAKRAKALTSLVVTLAMFQEGLSKKIMHLQQVHRWLFVSQGKSGFKISKFPRCATSRMTYKPSLQAAPKKQQKCCWQENALKERRHKQNLSWVMIGTFPTDQRYTESTDCSNSLPFDFHILLPSTESPWRGAQHYSRKPQIWSEMKTDQENEDPKQLGPKSTAARNIPNSSPTHKSRSGMSSFLVGC